MKQLQKVQALEDFSLDKSRSKLIKNIKKKQGESPVPVSRESQLANELNKFRFKNGKLIKQLLDLFSGQRAGVLFQNGKQLKLPTLELFERMRIYFREIEKSSQILPDLTFSQIENKYFISTCEEHIEQAKQLQGSETIQQFHSKTHYSYFIKDVQITNFDELLILLLVEEFILLNTKSRDNESLTLDFENSPQHLGLLDSLYNKLFLFIREKNNSNTFDIFILLTHDDNHGVNLISSSIHKKDRENQAIVPQKYSKLIHKSTQIPKQSIKNLVQLMDSDNDNRITVEDIQKFSHSKILFFQPNIYEEMFNDVTKLRFTQSPTQKQMPITVDEIWTSVQIHYQLGPDHTWVEIPKPFRQYWVELLKECGEKLPVNHDLPAIKIEAVRDQRQLSSKFVPNINTKLSTSEVEIRDLPKKSYAVPFRPEGGVIINNSKNIKRIIQDDQIKHFKEPEVFEKVVNLKIKQSNKGEFSTVKQETKNYYLEADRLSNNPRLYTQSPKNPIYKFIPEDIQKPNTSPGQEFFFSEQKKNKPSHRLNKITSSNFKSGLNSEQDTLSQFKEDDFDESDIENLLNTSSFRFSSTPNALFSSPQKQQHQESKQNLSELSPPKFQHHKGSKSGYPFNIFDPSFYGRKNMKDSSIFAQGRKQPSSLFLSSFKLEDCNTEKQKYFKVNNNNNNKEERERYIPANQSIVRESFPLLNKDKFITSFKCDPLKNPFGISENDCRPKEVLELESKQRKRKDEKEQMKFNDDIFKHNQDSEWKNYFKLADIDHNFVDRRRPPFLEKEKYTPNQDILFNLLRENYSDPVVPFKLFHRTIRTYDKNLSLGDKIKSKFQVPNESQKILISQFN